MEEKSLSLLAKIKSNYILQEVLCLAYEEMKPVLKLIKYNKSLLNKLNIIIQENYKYEIETEIHKNTDNCLTCYFIMKHFIFITFFLVYISIFYASGKFNDNNLKNGYSSKKKSFVDFMDNYILPIYFGFIIASFIFIIVFFYKFCALKKKTKLIINAFIFFTDLIHYIAYIIKLAFTIKLIKSNELKSTWFYAFDSVIIAFLSLFILLGCYYVAVEDDDKKYFINKFNGINIFPFVLSYEFGNLSVKEKNEIIFKKENLQEYEYFTNFDKIDLILNKINVIRTALKLPLLQRDEDRYLPDFIINEKTKMFFYPNENIYKLSPNFYVFKYFKDEFQNHINNNEIKNIITNALLDTISIIEKNEFEYISIYNKNNLNNNIQENNNNINIPRIQLDANINVNIANTEDKINDISERLTVSEKNDKGDDEISSIRNININKNDF